MALISKNIVKYSVEKYHLFLYQINASVKMPLLWLHSLHQMVNFSRSFDFIWQVKCLVSFPTTGLSAILLLLLFLASTCLLLLYGLSLSIVVVINIDLCGQQSTCVSEAAPGWKFPKARQMSARPFLHSLYCTEPHAT